VFRRILFFVITLSIFILYYGIPKVGAWLVKADDKVRSDAMIVLMGSVDDRILQAVDLYNQGCVTKMILVETASPSIIQIIKDGGGIHTSNTMESIELAVKMGFPSDSIVLLQGGARSTVEESIIISEYLKKKPEMDTLIIVSSADHMRRANIIFNKAAEYTGIDIKIYCIPSKYSDFNVERWWKKLEDIKAVFVEYLKLVHFFTVGKSKLKKHLKFEEIDLLSPT
jgi:uncharacterized SAM-binding protein YcdF (DUF218 family)